MNFSNSPDKFPVATKYREGCLPKVNWEHGVDPSSMAWEREESSQHLCSKIKDMQSLLYFTFFGHVLEVWGILNITISFYLIFFYFGRDTAVVS